MNAIHEQILSLADGVRPAREIAAQVGLSTRYVRRILLRHNAPRRRVGGGPGALNHRFVAGRRIDLDGYAQITVPNDHPYAKPRPQRETKLMAEHRWVMEQHLGRYLLPTEVVDHVDGLTLHNAVENLRLFASNGEHLASTARGPRRWSPEGLRNIGVRTDCGQVIQRVDSYGQRRKAGEIRLRQILLAALRLGTDSPYLLGTTHHTKKAGIDMSCRSTIERALADLYERWGWDQTQ